jgi:O-antigen ligase
VLRGTALFFCAAMLLTIAVLLPPEVHPWSRPVCYALAAASFALVVLGGGRQDHPPVPAWLLLLLPFAAASILAASCRSRAIDEGMDLLLLFLSGLMGRSLAEDERHGRNLGTVVVILAAVVALQAIVQHHVTYPGQAGLLRAVDPADPTGLLVRLEAGRPSGPFTLPAALGGFLALSIPCTVAGLVFAARPVGRAFAALGLALQVYALFLAQSIGAIFALAVGVVLPLPILGSHRRRMAWVALLLFALGTAWFVGVRRTEFGSGLNPLSLRAGNWGAAFRMIADHPFFGTGPGSFGTFYPRYMQPGMNETRFAHDSYLQAAAGWGVWVFVPLGILLMSVRRAARRARREPFPSSRIRLLTLVGCVAFLVHNLVDFTAYLPGVAIPAAIMLGLGLGPAGSEGDRVREGGRWFAGWRLIAVVLVVLLTLESAVAARSRADLRGALDAANRGEIDPALDLARRAVAARPGDPDPHALLAQLILGHRLDDDGLRKEGERAASAAVLLDPEAAILHYTRSLYHQAAAEPAPAYLERHAARLLYPLKELYRAGEMVRREVERP